MRSSRASRVWLVIVLAGTLVGCSTFSLSEQRTPLNVARQRHATQRACVVLPFAYEPSDRGEQKRMSQADLDRWQSIFAEGLERSGVFAEVVAVNQEDAGGRAGYVIDGEITKINFQKNWVPTFFPLHVGLSFFTFTLYTWLAGPTTVTDVDFGVTVHLRDGRSGEFIRTFSEYYDDTAARNIYSKGIDSPYENPSIVFTKIVDRLAARIAVALPGADFAPGDPSRAPAPESTRPEDGPRTNPLLDDSTD